MVERVLKTSRIENPAGDVHSGRGSSPERVHESGNGITLLSKTEALKGTVFESVDCFRPNVFQLTRGGSHAAQAATIDGRRRTLILA